MKKCISIFKLSEEDIELINIQILLVIRILEQVSNIDEVVIEEVKPKVKN
jgi:hypothetical protein